MQWSPGGASTGEWASEPVCGVSGSRNYQKALLRSGLLGNSHCNPQWAFGAEERVTFWSLSGVGSDPEVTEVSVAVGAELLVSSHSDVVVAFLQELQGVYSVCE